tara:strand:- start:4128 stop:4298 length:171 start_codon:yes stop_codon:yes gene_type:complete
MPQKRSPIAQKARSPLTKELKAHTPFTTAHIKLNFADFKKSILPPVYFTVNYSFNY